MDWMIVGLLVCIVAQALWILALQHTVSGLVETMELDGRLWKTQQEYNDNVDKDLNRCLDRLHDSSGVSHGE